MNKGIWIGTGVLLVVVIVVLMAARKNSSGTTSTPNVVTASTPPVTQKSTLPQGDVKEIKVEGKEYSFSPGSLAVKKGESVKLTFENAGAVSHNLVIDELGVKTKTIGSGQTDTVEFTADQSGTFSFYCSVDSHRSFGMVGSLEVK